MTPGQVARLALDCVINPATDDGIALVVIAVNKDGDTHVTTNLAVDDDLPRVLSAALETARDPEVKTFRPNPVRV